jgi:hypothetical protein
VRVDDLAQRPRRRPCQHAGDDQVTRQPPAPRHQRCHDNQADGPQGAEPVKSSEDGGQAVRQGVEEVEDRSLAPGDVTMVQRRHHEDHHAEQEAEPVASAAAQVALRRRAEHADAPRRFRLCARGLARGHHGVMVPKPLMAVA